jgi:hypothetical protein
MSQQIFTISLGSPFSINCESTTLIICSPCAVLICSSVTIPVPELEKPGSIPTLFKVYCETGMFVVSYCSPNEIHVCTCV